MYLEDLTDELSHPILLFGFGEENRQFYEWLTVAANVTASDIIITDARDTVDYLEQLKIQEVEVYKKEVEKCGEGCSNQVSFRSPSIYTGQDYLKYLKKDNIKKIFKSPGIWSLLPELEEHRQIYGDDSILSPLHFFVQKYRNNIIGVTGTKGKTTTASLITHALKKFGKKVEYCGNTVGVSPYKFWDNSSEIDEDTYFVIELSSFQLQDLGYSKLSPKYAAITNYYIDHQDQHATPEEYWAAKDNIFRYQQPGDVCIKNAQIVERSLPSARQTLVDQMYADTIKNTIHSPLIGIHNDMNMAVAVVMLQKILFVSLEDLAGVFVDFVPVPHRLQLVRTIQHGGLEICFYDDGAATEPQAVISAINALTTDENEHLWLHITGKDKGGDLGELKQLIELKSANGKIFRADYCGEIGGKLSGAKTLSFKDKITTGFSEFNEIVSTLNFGKLNVVLSPCGSSFDEFTNYKERSQWWVDQVQKISI
jgi:UDP-N-acetylmuramoyl-L-alanine---L-glutamate ligase